MAGRERVRVWRVREIRGAHSASAAQRRASICVAGTALGRGSASWHPGRWAVGSAPEAMKLEGCARVSLRVGMCFARKLCRPCGAVRSFVLCTYNPHVHVTQLTGHGFARRCRTAHRYPGHCRRPQGWRRPEELKCRRLLGKAPVAAGVARVDIEVSVGLVRIWCESACARVNGRV